MGPDEAVRFAVMKELAEPVIPFEGSGFFVYADMATDDAVGVVAFDVQEEVPHHFRLRIEKVDD